MDTEQVSIPLWFDLDDIEQDIATMIFPQVSIPLWFDLDILFVNTANLQRFVSIPLWFDLD